MGRHGGLHAWRWLQGRRGVNPCPILPAGEAGCATNEAAAQHRSKSHSTALACNPCLLGACHLGSHPLLGRCRLLSAVSTHNLLSVTSHSHAGQMAARGAGEDQARLE